MKILRGSTRSVVVIGKYAFKFPRVLKGWKQFLLGLLGNIQETRVSATKDERVIPVLFSVWGGFMIIMPSCTLVTPLEFAGISIKRFWYRDKPRITVEHKWSSFGWYKGKIVAVDYGNYQ